MKRLYITFAIILLFAITANAQNEKFINTMKNYISQLKDAKVTQDYLELSNSFERIASVEKSNWLPYYYAGYTNIVLSTFAKGKDNIDMYLDKADKLIFTADSLEKNNSEISTLKAFSAEMRISAEPMGRWQKYGGVFQNQLDKAMAQDTTNPRPYMLKGQMLMYTPEQFGGGLEAAKPYFDSAKEKFDSFKPKSEIHPNWGKEYLEQVISSQYKQDK